eukprot:m51a1_g7616 hypothetical protein (542) ;mRNA; r:278996-281202
MKRPRPRPALLELPEQLEKVESFQGFVNFMFILLGMTTFRMLLREYTGRGYLVDLSLLRCVAYDWASALPLLPALGLLSVSVFGIVKLRATRTIGRKRSLALYCGAMAALFVVPVYAFWRLSLAPLTSAVIALWWNVLIMKSHSYYVTNVALHDAKEIRRQQLEDEAAAAAAKLEALPPASRDLLRKSGQQLRLRAPEEEQRKASQELRKSAGHIKLPPSDDADAQEGARARRQGQEAREQKAEEQEDCPKKQQRKRKAKKLVVIPGAPSLVETFIDPNNPYPANVTLGGFLEFLAVPTLVYDPAYPRTPRVRPLYAAKEFMQCGVCFLVSYIALKDFLLPTLLKKSSTGLLLEDIIQLSVPSIIVWLLGFYALLHCFLNGMSELTRFADREFYTDWWNSSSLDVFWRRWNIPVHTWLLRHVYCASKRAATVEKLQWPDAIATWATFGFSAIMHELVLCVMFKVVKPWFFIVMLIQVPMIVGSKWLVSVLPPQNAKRWGNCFVWLGLFLCHPLLELFYLREWVHDHGAEAMICLNTPPSWW